jgi:hypothetical protein
LLAEKHKLRKGNLCTLFSRYGLPPELACYIHFWEWAAPLMRESRRIEEGRLVTQRTYHPNGALGKECFWKDELRDGLWKGFHSDGTQGWEIPMKEGKRHGVWREWDKNGKLAERIPWKNGKRHGIFRREANSVRCTVEVQPNGSVLRRRHNEGKYWELRKYVDGRCVRQWSEGMKGQPLQGDALPPPIDL